ncbi:hypothetical protein [Streptomyces viridosporus]|uniref:hypothetical protein n=1 Tax=Streptomyces viridosporus TaxID=67581 RepID=UPI0036F57BF2
MALQVSWHDGMYDWPGDDAEIFSKSSLGLDPAVLGREPLEPLLNSFAVIICFPLRVTLPAWCLLGEQGPELVSGVEIADLSGVHYEWQPPGAVSNVESLCDSPAYRVREQVKVILVEIVLQGEDGCCWL